MQSCPSMLHLMLQRLLVSQDAGVCSILLSAQQDSFMQLADAARQLRADINDSGALQVSLPYAHMTVC